MSRKQEIMRLAAERNHVMEFAVAAGKLLAWAGTVAMPLLKSHVEQAIDTAFEQIRYETKMIRQLKGRR